MPLEVGGEQKLQQDIMNSIHYDPNDSFIKKIALYGEKYLSSLVFTYTILSILSTIGRGDFNVAVSIYGIFFLKTLTDREKMSYLNALLVCILFDLIWFGAEGNVADVVQADGLTFTLAPRYASMAISILNLLIKIPLSLFLYASAQNIKAAKELEVNLETSETREVSVSNASRH